MTPPSSTGPRRKYENRITQRCSSRACAERAYAVRKADEIAKAKAEGNDEAEGRIIHFQASEVKSLEEISVNTGLSIGRVKELSANDRRYVAFVSAAFMLERFRIPRWPIVSIPPVLLRISWPMD